MPFLIPLNQVSAHGSVTFVQAYAQLRSLVSAFKFEKALLDSDHDAYAIYRLLNQDEIEAFIDLNERNLKSTASDDAIKIYSDIIPVCQAGLQLLRWGIDKKRQQIR